MSRRVQTGRGGEIVKRNAAATRTEDAGERRLSQPLGACSPHAPGDRHGRPEAARPRGRDRGEPRRRARPSGPRLALASCGPARSASPGHLPREKSILMAVAVHADPLAPHPQSAPVSSLEAGPSPRSCRRRPRAPFTFSRPSHPEGSHCRRHRRRRGRRGPRAPPPSPGRPRPPNSRRLRLARAGGSS